MSQQHHRADGVQGCKLEACKQRLHVFLGIIPTYQAGES